METGYSQDIGEEIISKLKEINLILEKLMEEKRNGKKCPFALSCRNRLSQ